MYDGDGDDDDHIDLFSVLVVLKLAPAEYAAHAFSSK